MEKKEIIKAFDTAYNHFDWRPLSGETLKTFYVESITKESTKRILSNIHKTERYDKLLVIGHRGCGKSTIINKVVEDLNKEYHVVVFSVLNVLNMMDVETIDILVTTYMEVIKSMEKAGVTDFTPATDKVLAFLKTTLKLTEVGVSLLGSLSLKIKTEPDSRKAIRDGFRNQIEIIQKSFDSAFKNIQQQTQKDILIIIDDLDKLETEFAEQIFFKDSQLLMMPEAKIIYTFPLDTYYSESFNQISSLFKAQFIPVVNLYDASGNYQTSALEHLKELVYRRIDKTLISEDALRCVIDCSGGLVRDLVKFMQDACSIASLKEVSIIDQAIAQEATSELVNDFYRIFDFPEYRDSVEEIMKSKEKKKIKNTTLVYLLKYLFVVEYRHRNKPWYDAHPCLKKAMKLPDV